MAIVKILIKRKEGWAIQFMQERDNGIVLHSNSPDAATDLLNVNSFTQEESPFVIGKNPMPPLDPHCADAAPDGPALTLYDEEHAITYIRMLAADAEGADWRDVARIVLHIDPDDNATRARWAYESHLARTKWVVKHSYRLLLRRGELNRDLSGGRS